MTTKKSCQFPKGFLWGAATASYQVEGGINNCDWAEAARQNKVPNCGTACDHYNLYESDFDIAQKLGHNCHKISIEWARIEPKEGVFDSNEAAHYRNVIRALRVRGLEPFVNIWHFTLPTWFADDGGFANSKAVRRFERYAEFVAKEILADEKNTVKFVLTMNEPLVWSGNGYIHKKWPPFKKDFLRYLLVCRNLIKAHRAAYRTIKSILPEAQVSIAKHNMYFAGYGLNPINHLRAAIASYFWNRFFLNRIKNQLDFIGLNQYFFRPSGRSSKRPKNLPLSDMGWEIFPESLYHVILELVRYKKPIYIIENGLADADDSRRTEFLRGYIQSVWRAIGDGAVVAGYMHWSFMDNYEWVYGFEKRFGLVEIDFKNLERRIRPSAYFYKIICETNSIDASDVKD